MKASFAFRHVPADVRELVKQAEPEIIEPVIAQRETDDRRAVGQLQRGAVQMRARQMFEAD